MSLRPKFSQAHKLSVRFGLTTIDQSVASLSNFAVGVAVARVAGVAGLGAYALVYSAWLFLNAIHRSLITDPMSIENDVHQPDAAQRIRVGLAAELWLGMSAAVVFLAIGAILVAFGAREFGVCFIGLAPWLPCLLAQDYWRWVAFMKAQPQRALANDVLFDGIQISAFVALYFIGVHSSLLAVISWGVGAVGGSLFGLWQFSTRPSLRGGIGRIRDRWSLSKWLVAANAANQATSQSTLVLTGAFLGAAGIGGMKAATLLVTGPSNVLLQAGGNIGLPETSKALMEQGWPGLRRVERFITAAGMASVGFIAVVVICFGRQLLALIYGQEFAKYALIADVVAISYFTATLSLGAILSLKATQNTRLLFPVTLLSLVVTVIAVVVLAPLFGLLGAAVGALIGNVAMSAGYLVMHWTTSRKAAERMANSGTDLALAEPVPAPPDRPPSVALERHSPVLAVSEATTE